MNDKRHGSITMWIIDIYRQLKDVLSMPEITVNLMYSSAESADPFYANIVKSFYEDARKRHRKFLFVRAIEYGVAVCQLPPSFDEYFMMIEGSARRNYRKARRLGYSVRRIDYNEHLEEIAEIWHSTPVRQGKLPDKFLEGKPEPCSNPLSHSPMHDYPYYGVFYSNGQGNGKLVAYAGCLVAGELCLIEQIMGHADKQSDGIVPFLIIEIVEDLLKSYRTVRYYAFGTYFGAGVTMRRFKRKFRFLPCRVRWLLG